MLPRRRAAAYKASRYATCSDYARYGVEVASAMVYSNRWILYPSFMLRKFLSCLLLLMITLQGVAQVSADVLPESNMEQHCAGHDRTAGDCDCCPSGVAMTAGCASLCAVMAMPSCLSITVPQDIDAEHRWVLVSGTASPSYLPLIPPPIA
jgi:hypothetical protein